MAWDGKGFGGHRTIVIQGSGENKIPLYLAFNSDRQPQFDNGLLFQTAHNERLVVPTSILNLPAWTIECEVKIDSAIWNNSNSFQVILAHLGAINQIGIYKEGSSTDLTFRTRNNSGSMSNIAVPKPADGWVKLGLAAGNKLTAYVNGAVAGTPIDSPNLPSVKDTGISIGADSGGGYCIENLVRNFVFSKIERDYADMATRAQNGYAIDSNVTASMLLESDLNAYAYSVM